MQKIAIVRADFAGLRRAGPGPGPGPSCNDDTMAAGSDKLKLFFARFCPNRNAAPPALIAYFLLGQCSNRPKDTPKRLWFDNRAARVVCVCVCVVVGIRSLVGVVAFFKYFYALSHIANGTLPFCMQMGAAQKKKKTFASIFELLQRFNKMRIATTNKYKLYVYSY